MTSAPIARPPARIVSIDIFRGLTMAVMIFVNALDGVQGLPWWTFHAHAEENVMTYVDMVFPFFLFIVGMSMPLAIERRLARDSSQFRLWSHIVVRAVSLIVLGLILANAGRADAARMGLSGAAWALIALIAAMFYLNVYPQTGRITPFVPYLRYGGLAVVAACLAIFRARPVEGRPGWLDFSYPEILGLIGFTYLATAILYVPARRRAWMQYVWLAALLTLCALSTARIIPFPGRLSWMVWPWSNGALCALVMAGIVTSVIFFPDGRPREWPRAALPALGVALLAFSLGVLLIPLGISKIRATPTWVLWSVAAAMPLFLLLYWICDVRGSTRWAFWVRAAGANTLTTYLLPDLWYFATVWLGVTFYEAHFNAGWPGVIKTVVFTLVMLAAASVLTRARVRLQL